jgi:hypothetical protein
MRSAGDLAEPEASVKDWVGAVGAGQTTSINGSPVA